MDINKLNRARFERVAKESFNCVKEERGNYGHKGPFWYFTTHGLGPGTLPKDINVLDSKEGQNKKGIQGLFIALDGVLTGDELKYFDLIELSPESVASEGTEKQGNSWVNKGKEGTHGKFKTKKQADAQRRAMYANGFEAKEDYEENSDSEFDAYLSNYLNYDEDDEHYLFGLPSEYEKVSSKTVYDQNGFTNEYFWWMNPSTGHSYFFFGETTEPDWQTDSLEEAQEWFDNYKGFEEELEDFINVESATESTKDKISGKKTLYNKDIEQINKWAKKIEKDIKEGLPIVKAKERMRKLCEPMMNDLLADEQDDIYERLHLVIEDSIKSFNKLRSKR